VRSAANGVHQTCDACHGFSVTVWLFGEMLVEGAGGELWRASEDAPADGDGCPACRRPMAEVAARAGSTDAAAATVEVCRACELVWVDPEDIPLLPVLPALGTAAGVTAPGPTHCPSCGAPYADTAAGRCSYCKAAVPRQSLDVVAPLLAQLEAAEHAKGRESSGLVERYIDTITHQPSGTL
jgi:hypothetical protein